MNLTGSLRRLCALLDGPRANLLLAGGEVAHQAEQVVADLDQTVQTGLMQAELGQEHLLLLCVHAGDILLQLCADRQNHRAFCVCDSLYRLEALVLGVVAGEAFLVHVCRIDDLLRGQQVALTDDAVNVLVLAKALEGAGGLALLQMRLQALEDLHVTEQLLVCLRSLAGAVETALEVLDVRKDQLEVDGLDVTGRIDRAFNVHDVLVVEAADNVNDGVNLADVGQELVAKALTLACAAHQTGDVHELDHRRRGLLCVIEIGQRLQTLIRYSDHADVRVDGAERIVCAFRARLRNCVKQGRLADVWQSDDAEFHNIIPPTL